MHCNGLRCERLEFLLGELLTLCSYVHNDAEQMVKSKLVALQNRCTQANVLTRPLFSEVMREILLANNLYMEVTNKVS